MQAPYGLLALAISLFVIGVFLHFTTDMQKHTALRLQPERLITTGMMARSRNLNYFGELLLYLALALLAMHWLPLLVLLGYVILVWGPNMQREDRSLARYAEFDAYRRRTNWFISFIPLCGPSAIRQSPRLASMRRQRSWPGRALERVASPGIAPPVSHSGSVGGWERRKPRPVPFALAEAFPSLPLVDNVSYYSAYLKPYAFDFVPPE